jgi:hypothetical protein
MDEPADVKTKWICSGLVFEQRFYDEAGRLKEVRFDCQDSPKLSLADPVVSKSLSDRITDWPLRIKDADTKPTESRQGGASECHGYKPSNGGFERMSALVNIIDLLKNVNNTDGLKAKIEVDLETKSWTLRSTFSAGEGHLTLSPGKGNKKGGVI